MGKGRFVCVFVTVSAVVAIAACEGHPAAVRPPVPLRFVNADRATVIAGSYADVRISVNEPGVTIGETGKMPGGLSLRTARAGTALLVGRLRSGTGGQYALDLTASDAGRRVSQRFTLTVNQPPAFPGGDLRSMVFATGGSGAEQFLVLATGYPRPTVAEFGELQPGRSFQAIVGGGALISGSPPGLFETPCNSRIRLVASNSAGTATMNVEVRLRNVWCSPDFSVFFSVLKGAIVIGPPIWAAGKDIGHWIMEGGRKIGRLIRSKNGKAIAEDTLEDSDE